MMGFVIVLRVPMYLKLPLLNNRLLYVSNTTKMEYSIIKIKSNTFDNYYHKYPLGILIIFFVLHLTDSNLS